MGENIKNNSRFNRVVYFNKYVVLTENYKGKLCGYLAKEFRGELQVGKCFYERFNDGHYFEPIEYEEPKNPQIEDLCIVKKIDKDFIYLIKNGDKNVIKLNKSNGDFSPLDLVYIDGNNLIKDQYFTKYFKLFLEKFDRKVELKKNKFKVRRFLIEDFYEHGVAICPLDDIHDISYIGDYMLNGNYSYGDIYLEFTLDSSSACVYEEDMKPLNVVYNQVMMKDLSTKGKSLEEKYQILSDRVNFLKEKRKILLKASKKAEAYYKLHPLPYTQDDVIATYSIMELEFEDTFRLENLYDEDDYNNYVNVDELPKYARPDDDVVLVKDKLTGQKKYYFTRVNHKGSYDYDLYLWEVRLDGIKDKLFFQN